MIIKVRKSRQYENIPVRTLQDQRLRLDELGLLVRLISRPDGWEIRPPAIRKETGWGRERLCRVLRNLEKCGYLRRFAGHSTEEGGHDTKKVRGAWDWTSEIYAESQDIDFCEERLNRSRVTRTTAHPSTGEPCDGQPGCIINTDLNQHRSKSISSSSNPDLDDDKKFLALEQAQAREEDEYICLALRHGNITDPVGFEIAKRKEWARGGGGLSDLDRRQLEHRRRLEVAGQGQQVSNDTAALQGLAQGLAAAFDVAPGRGGQK